MPLIFTKKADRTLKIIALSILLLGGSIAGATYYYGTPEYTRVGYAPEQPVPFSHKLHVGKLGMSCVYCHSNVEKSPHANVPSTQTCMSCHNQIKADSPLLAKVRESWQDGNPVEWERIHKLPDYAHFNHALHINRGVSCVSCHGQVNEMDVAYHAKPLSMSWCLECHRHPENYLRPRESVPDMEWKPPHGIRQIELGKDLKESWKINPSQSCQGCHR